MDTRRTKQLIYGGIYAIFWIAVIALVYFLFARPAPSCFDHIQNEGEQGVDCGGPCAKACIPSNLAAIVPLTPGVYTFPATPGADTFLVEVENANSGFAAQSFDYNFDLYDASGTIVQSIPGQSFIYGSEVKYLLVVNQAVSSTFDHAQLSVSNVDWVPAATLGIVPQFGNPLPPTGSSISSSTITVTGELTDRDISAFQNILIVAVFRGDDNSVLGASQTEIDGIAPQQSQSFSVIYPNVPGIDPALTQFYAYALRP